MAFNKGFSLSPREEKNDAGMLGLHKCSYLSMWISIVFNCLNHGRHGCISFILWYLILNVSKNLWLGSLSVKHDVIMYNLSSNVTKSLISSIALVL